MHEDERTDQNGPEGTATGVPGAWANTDRHPELPGDSLAVYSTGRRTVIFDATEPGAYLGGDAVEVGE